jgi:hypothetical protein
VAAKIAGNDPGVARKTEIFLDKQAQILETQNQHLKKNTRRAFTFGRARDAVTSRSVVDRIGHLPVEGI